MKKGTKIVIGLFVFIAVLLFFNVPQGHISSYYYNKSIKQMRSNKYKQAKSSLDKAVFFLPNNKNISLAYGILELKFKKMDKAIQLFTRFISKNENSFQAHYWRGHTFFKMKRNKEAISDYKKALSINKKASYLHVNIAAAHNDSHQFAKSIQHYKKAIKEWDTPDKYFLHSDLGQEYLRNGQCEKALNSHEKAKALLKSAKKRKMKIKPSLYIAIKMANYLIAKENNQKALALLLGEKEKLSINRGIHLPLATLYLNTNKLDLALKHANASVKKHPSSSAYNVKGQIFYRRKQYQKAITEFNNVIHMDKNSIVAFYNRGLSYYMLKNLNKAQKDISDAIVSMKKRGQSRLLQLANQAMNQMAQKTQNSHPKPLHTVSWFTNICKNK